MPQSERTGRQSTRLDVIMPARCRSRSGFVDHVVITDISIGGCRIESRALTLREGDLVVISPKVIEGICARVCWVNGHQAGIAFLSPLYGPVVEHLHRGHADFRITAHQPPVHLRLAA